MTSHNKYSFTNQIEFKDLDFFNSDSGGYGIVVAGSSKSFFLKHVSKEHFEQGARVIILDTGFGYSSLCSFYEGESVEVSDSLDISINPFSLVRDINDSVVELGFCFSHLISPTGELTHIEEAFIRDAILKVWQEKGNKSTVTDVYQRLADSSADVARSLAGNLLPYVGSGEFAKYFQGDWSLSFNNKFSLVDLSALCDHEGNPRLLRLITVFLLYGINLSLYSFNSLEEKIVIFDDIIPFIDDSISYRFMELILRRSRQCHATYFIGLHSIGDLSGRAALVALHNFRMTILFKHTLETLSISNEFLNFDEQEISFILDSNLKLPHSGEQAIIHHREGYFDLLSLDVDSFSTLLYSYDAKDLLDIEKYTNVGMSRKDAIKKVLIDRQ